ncbi:MAG: HEPN domain-containing protein [Melioribacteraceae bacterium]
MREEINSWLEYSQENIKAAQVLLESELFNPCLQNVQQSIEKSLKFLSLVKGIPIKKTHNIMELKSILEKNDIIVDLTEDECDFLDSIYLPSKYPIGSALPDFYADHKVCSNSIQLAERVLKEVILLSR